jgi:hypothetical protein
VKKWPEKVTTNGEDGSYGAPPWVMARLIAGSGLAGRDPQRLGGCVFGDLRPTLALPPKNQERKKEKKKKKTKNKVVMLRV